MTSRAEPLPNVTSAGHQALVRAFCEQLLSTCEKHHGVLPGQVLNGRRKTEAIHKARAELARWMFEHVGRQRVKGVAAKIWRLEVFPSGILPDGWDPVSTTLLGQCFGMDHSSMVCMRKAWRNSQAEPQKPESFSENVRAHGLESVHYQG